MKPRVPRFWGNTRLPGGVLSGAIAVHGKSLVLVMSRWDLHATALGMKIDVDGLQVHRVWSHPLPLGPYHVFKRFNAEGRQTVLPRTDGTVYIVAGGARMLVEASSGNMIAEHTSLVSPSAHAILIDDCLLVPEGRAVAAYESATLQPLWRRPTPNLMWAGDMSVDGVCALGRGGDDDEDEDREQTLLWDIMKDTTTSVTSLNGVHTPVNVASAFIVPSGAGAVERLAALDRETMNVLWTTNHSSPASGPFWTPPTIRVPVIAYGDRLVAVTNVPAVECRQATTGRLIWSVSLPDQGSAVSFIGGNVWVAIATDDLKVLVLRADTGAIHAQYSLQDPKALLTAPIAGTPQLILPVSDSEIVLVVGLLGGIFGI